MITIFKTNVESEEEAMMVLNYLFTSYPNFEINFDLEDCDNILRVKGEKFTDAEIFSVLNTLGYSCEALPF